MPTAGWLCIALTLAYGGALAADTPATVLAFGLLALLAAKRVGLPVLVLGFACLAFGGARAHATLGRYEAERDLLLRALPAAQSCNLEGEIVASPTANDRGAVVVLEIGRASCPGGTLPALLRARIYGLPDGLRRGDLLRVQANLGVVRSFRNLGVSRPELRAATDRVVLSTASCWPRVAASPRRSTSFGRTFAVVFAPRSRPRRSAWLARWCSAKTTSIRPTPRPSS